jgi:hypothetical protein
VRRPRVKSTQEEGAPKAPRAKPERKPRAARPVSNTEVKPADPNKVFVGRLLPEAQGLMLAAAH